MPGDMKWILALGVLLICAVWILKNQLQLKKLRRTAFLDPVTGGLTEVAFQQTCRKLLKRDSGGYTLVSVQVENLPQLCRSFGAETREHTLRRVHEALQAQLSSSEPAARIGEDSFCFLLKNRLPDEVCARLDRFSAGVNRGNDESAYPLQLSFGIYFPEKADGDIKDLQARAAFARQNGLPDHQYSFYDRSRWESSAWEREMAAAMDHAIQVSEFVVYYQPKIRVSDQKIVGAEALLRWRHPQRGLLSPDMFLAVAERYQKISSIDRYIFEMVCQTLARWKKKGWELCPVSLNLARADLERTNFVDECYETCCRYQIAAEQIEFEMEEHLLTENPERAKSFIQRLHAVGFRCAVDNFGVDATSLQLLGELDVDTVKLDRSFFRGDNNSRRGRYIVEALLKLTAQLHIRTVAEGIDDPGQVKYLGQVGCDMIQGFYYFKPMPLEKFEGAVYSQNLLTYVQGKESLVDQPEQREENLAGPALRSANSILQFSYLLQEDVVEFSEAFSPVLNGQTKLGEALAMFRTSMLIHENDREDFFRLLERCRREDGWVENTLRFYMSNGRYSWLELRMHRTGGVISGTMVNMAQWKGEVDRWKEKAARDTLTGLYNRDHFERTVRNGLKEQAYSSAAMIFIDVDNFKRINDTLGHMFGDDVLCWVAKQILGVFRHTDVIARYGGDEFVVFAPFIQQSVLEDRLKRLCGAFQFPYRNSTMDYKVSGSIGAAMYPQDGGDYEALLDHADCALYEAKSRGKDQYVMYEPHMQGDKSKK